MNMCKQVKKFLCRYSKSDHYMIHKTFDVSAALFKKSKENKPALEINLKGNFKVSLLQIALILSAALLFLLGASLLWRTLLFYRYHKKR